jgi:hypothetical protein
MGPLWFLPVRIGGGCEQVQVVYRIASSPNTQGLTSLMILANLGTILVSFAQTLGVISQMDLVHLPELAALFEASIHVSERKCMFLVIMPLKQMIATRRQFENVSYTNGSTSHFRTPQLQSFFSSCGYSRSTWT